MNAPFNQQDRQGRLSTVLGNTTLVLLRMDGDEELSGDFVWRVEALSDQSGLDLEALLGTHATVEIDHANGTRHFDGIVTEAVHRGPDENGWRYDLILRPWLHVAGLRRNMRIFHNKTVIQIIEDVLSAYAGLGKPHLDVQTTGDYPVLEYTVQYGESDADFIRRQMERFGITWSWKHEAGSHTLLLTDADFSLPDVPGKSRPYFGVDGYNRQEEEHFKIWSSAQRITTGAVRLTEYNFKTPNAAQEVNQTGDASHAYGDVESYDWPGDYLDQGEGRGVVARRTDAERGQAPRHRASGDVVTLGVGWRVKLAGDDVPGATGQTFTCLKAEHHFRSQAYGSGIGGADETPYEGAYVLLPEGTPFKSERRQIGPKVQGPETAVVVGEGEIDCDEHGRILVRFHWDLDGANTMRVRVSQNWASKGWGGMVIPRIGMEVIVEHLRGDPDKPIVTGCVYNGKNTPPYELPKHKARSTFMTDTHKGKGFNELRFEDNSGHEEIRFHAQKDMNTIVRNDEAKLVMRNSQTSVRDNQFNEVFGDDLQVVMGSKTILVGGGHMRGLQSNGIGAIANRISKAARKLTESRMPGGGNGDLQMILDGNHAETVTGSQNTIVGKGARQDIGGTLSTKVRKNFLFDVFGTVTQRFHKSVRITAATKLVMICGSSRFEMHSDGKIKLVGTDIEIDGATKTHVKGGRLDLN